MVARRCDRFDRWDDVELDRIARLPVEPGPWCNEVWLIRDAPGDSRRGARSVCACRECARDVYWLGGGDEIDGTSGVGLCYGHYFRWLRAGRPPVKDWLANDGSRPLGRTRGRPLPEPINFARLPVGVAHEIRFVVGRKISRGDWTPNRSLRKFLVTLILSAQDRVDDSLLERPADQWLLLTRQWWPPITNFDKTCAPYVRSFFRLLEGATDPDPWADDKWAWRDSFEFVLSATDAASPDTRAPLDWSAISVAWLRNALQRMAKQQLITSAVAWNTVGTWIRAGRLFSDYLTETGIAEPQDVDRPLFLEYLAWVRGSRGGKVTALASVNTMAYLLETLNDTRFVRDLGSAVFLRRGENTRAITRNPRPFPADVIERVDRLIVANPTVDATIRTMVATTRWAGCRISELVALPIDCLHHNDGGYWIEYWMTKTQAWRRFPIPDSLAENLLDQQRRVHHEYGNTAKHLFPGKRSNAAAGVTKPWSTSGLRHHLSALFEEQGITSSTVTGEQISGGDVHRFRHTVGMTLLNNGWTQQEVRDFLGHASDTMTSAYARITDETLARKAREFWASQETNGAQVNAGVERLRAKFIAALPNGFCRLPATQKCDFRPNPCQDCSFHDAGGRAFLGTHILHRDQLRSLISEADAAGDSEVIALNQPMLDKVEKIITELQDEHPASEGTDDTEQ